jgi:hypothetical protein
MAGSLSFTASAATTSGGNWLSVAPTGGTTNTTLTVSVNTAGLAAGTYSGSVVIAASLAANPSVTVPVTQTLALMPSPSRRPRCPLPTTAENHQSRRLDQIIIESIKTRGHCHAKVSNGTPSRFRKPRSFCRRRLHVVQLRAPRDKVL